MTYKFLRAIVFALLLFTLIVRATNTIQNEATTESYSDEDIDRAIENFIRGSMENYNIWLAKHDPSSVHQEEIHLDSNDIPDPIPKDMDVVLNIKNQYMANHSKYDQTEYTNVRSDIKNKNLSVSYDVLYQNENVVFTGEYNASGMLNVLGTKIPFNGQGIWKLKCDTIWEPITYNFYTTNDAGYIDLGSVEDMNHKYYTTFVDFEYENLQFEYDGEISSEMWTSVYSGLADTYWMYIQEEFEAYKNSPPKQLLHTYLKEIFLSTKLDDIALEWKPTTTKAPPSSGINDVLENVWLLFFGVLLVLPS